MSKYDQLAFTSRPTLYLSAPQTIDKSGAGLFSLTNNNLVASGQPIIYGNNSSFYMDSSKTVDVVGNPLFFGETTSLEVVGIMSKPTEDVPIVVDDNSLNGLYISPTGITLRLFFETSTSTYSKIVFIKIKDWNRKLHITVTLSSNEAALRVNNDYANLLYGDTVVSSSNLTIGGGYSGYYYLLDGIGFYAGPIKDKTDAINDPGTGHSIYSSYKYNGTSTLFDNPIIGNIETFNLSNFSFTTDPSTYTFIYFVSRHGEETKYISVKANDENVNVSYVINLDSTGEFLDYILLDNIDEATLVFSVLADEVDDDFELTIESFSDGNITTATPALLNLTGMALYGDPGESIVNISDSTLLSQSTYTGTWISTSPKTIEIVFKAIESSNNTIVLSSIDGEVSYGPTGAISGYTAYLNGQLVTDMTGVLINQWNHLVLTISAPSSNEFYLNSDDGLSSTQNIAYMLMTTYDNELTSDQIEELYLILVGTDIISVQESPLDIVEGEFDNSLPFNYYSYAWSIIGAGGS